jgi:hypothetical protein
MNDLSATGAIGVELIDQYRAVFSTVPAQVALAVAVHVEPTDHARPQHRLLPDPGVDRATVPRHILRQTDVDRYQGGHGPDPSVQARQPIVNDTSRARESTTLANRIENDNLQPQQGHSFDNGHQQTTNGRGLVCAARCFSTSSQGATCRSLIHG